MSQSKVTVEDFHAAGFDDAEARRGVQMLESGAYFNFGDAATALAGGYFPKPGHLGPSGVQLAQIAEVAKRVDGTKTDRTILEEFVAASSRLGPGGKRFAEQLLDLPPARADDGAAAGSPVTLEDIDKAMGRASR